MRGKNCLFMRTLGHLVFLLENVNASLGFTPGKPSAARPCRLGPLLFCPLECAMRKSCWHLHPLSREHCKYPWDLPRSQFLRIAPWIFHSPQLLEEGDVDLFNQLLQCLMANSPGVSLGLMHLLVPYHIQFVSLKCLLPAL